MIRAALVVLALLAASPAHAQLGDRLGDPSPPRVAASSPSARLPGLAAQLGDPAAPYARETAPAPQPAEPPPQGPQIQLGYGYYRLSDGHGGGDVHAGGLEVLIPLPVRQLRVGLVGELGARDYSLGGDDFIVRGGVELGLQLPDLFEPFIPHVAVLGSVGGVIGQRFETTVTHVFGGAGIALGGELRIYRNLHVGAQGSYQRMEMEGASYDVFMLRLYAGL